jgi:multifunctional 2-oxoglutarate metabolism enzyme
VEALLEGSFRETIDDPYVSDPASVRRIVLATGKVGHDAIAARDAAGAPVAVVRVEQLYPWPFDQLDEIVARYPNAADIVWLQEEPENMGAWTFVRGRLYDRFGDSHSIRRVSRYESGSPATGSHTVHAQEQAQLLEAALAV